MLILYYVTYTHAFKCSRSSVILTRQRRATIMTTSRKPLKPLRDFLHHVAKFCLLPRDVRGKRFFQKFVLNYCNAKLPSWHVSNHHDQAMLQCHEIYWQALKRYGGKPCKLAEWCHLLISNRDTNQPWSRWCVHIAACVIDPSYNLVPAKERYGVCLDDGTAFGPGHQRILFDSLEKYMGGREIATYIFEHGVPQMFDANQGFDVTSSTLTKLLIQTLDWWMEFIRNYVMYEHGVTREEDYATFGKIKKLRSRPSEFRSSPYKTTTATPGSRHDSWRQGQRGEWLWLEDGYVYG
tara:strand:- start:77 stop:958 length:882 start_codon:yes stop_codon:yes gene_type:complete